MLRFNRLTSLLTATFILIATLPMVGVMLISNHTALEENEAASGSSLAMLADNTLDVMYRNLFERYGDVQAFALNPTAIAMDPAALTPVTNAYTDLYDCYDLMVISDVQGRIIAVNLLDYEGKALPGAQGLIGTSLDSQPWFAKAMATPAGVTDYADFERSPLVAAATGEAGDALRFYTPISRGDEVVGMLTK